ncbi:MAG: hypothetical protein FJZ01_23360 [Candidatus Sericytochromatia bacterium]|nr:hypothetical protein [Candidatus Tanganyikabacteria bacterium]
MPKAHRQSLFLGLALMAAAGLGTATWFGYKGTIDLGQIGRQLPAGLAPTAPPEPTFPPLPLSAGQRVNNAVSALTARGWRIANTYDVTTQAGPHYVVEAAKGGFNARLYFKGGKLVEAERF